MLIYFVPFMPYVFFTDQLLFLSLMRNPHAAIPTGNENAEHT